MEVTAPRDDANRSYCGTMSPRPDGSFWVCSFKSGHDGNHSWADKVSEVWDDSQEVNDLMAVAYEQGRDDLIRTALGQLSFHDPRLSKKALAAYEEVLRNAR